MSPEEATAMVSVLITGTLVWICDLNVAAQQFHPFFYIESGMYSAQIESEFDQRNRHGGLHPDHDCLSAQNSRHRRGVGQHSPDERIYDVERGDIDQDALGVYLGDSNSEIVLQRRR